MINLHLLTETYPWQCAQAHVKLPKFIHLMKIVKVHMEPFFCVLL